MEIMTKMVCFQIIQNVLNGKYTLDNQLSNRSFEGLAPMCVVIGKKIIKHNKTDTYIRTVGELKDLTLHRACVVKPP